MVLHGIALFCIAVHAVFCCKADAESWSCWNVSWWQKSTLTTSGQMISTRFDSDFDWVPSRGLRISEMPYRLCKLCISYTSVGYISCQIGNANGLYSQVHLAGGQKSFLPRKGDDNFSLAPLLSKNHHIWGKISACGGLAANCDSLLLRLISPPRPRLCSDFSSLTVRGLRTALPPLAGSGGFAPLSKEK